jgi:hypothetical protein
MLWNECFKLFLYYRIGKTYIYNCILLHSFRKTLKVRRKYSFINYKNMSPKVMWNKIPLQTLFIKSNRKISGLSNVQKSRTLSRSDLPLLPLEILSNIYAL